MGLLDDLLSSTASGLKTVGTGIGKGVVEIGKIVQEAWKEGTTTDDQEWSSSKSVGLVGRSTEKGNKGARPFILPTPTEDNLPTADALVTAALAASDDDQQTSAAARVDTSVARAGK